MERVTTDDGVRLWTETTGPDRAAARPVLLLHGGPGLWDYLRPVAALLEEDGPVHRFDQRGCGRSDPSDDLRMARAVADIEALRRHFGHARWTVVGHSFGATLALAYAWTHPGRVASLVALNGTGLGDWRTAYRAERDRRATAEERARLGELAALARRSPGEEREFRTLAWCTDHADRARARRWAAEDAAAPHAINWSANRRLAAEADGWTETWVRARLRRITAPAAVVHGAGDPRPAGPPAALARALPRGRFQKLPAAGHHPWRERPDQLRELLRRAVAARADADDW
ncbi:alpha/beta fold hydrolase [Streptomyces zhaozhouensis]|uniref:alpha/beta fold hydrolase n=1 Tax=Streptomyces zhaozhouensis TaxID=1300267 RepID=UPI001485222D|nr:alpha/beta hydrolase [Streptomyces zhaozhouensis]